MNTKAKEKVDNSTELFRQKQAEMSDKQLIELAEKQVTELARTGGRSHIMCVPPEITDTDMLFSELIRRFKLRCDGQPVADTESGLHLHNVSVSVCTCEYPAKMKGENKCWRCKKPFKEFLQTEP